MANWMTAGRKPITILELCCTGSLALFSGRHSQQSLAVIGRQLPLTGVFCIAVWAGIFGARKISFETLIQNTAEAQRK